MRVRLDNNIIDVPPLNGTWGYISGVATPGGVPTNIYLTGGKRVLNVYGRCRTSGGVIGINGGDIIRVDGGAFNLELKGMLVDPWINFNSPIDSYFIDWIVP